MSHVYVLFAQRMLLENTDWPGKVSWKLDVPLEVLQARIRQLAGDLEVSLHADDP